MNYIWFFSILGLLAVGCTHNNAPGSEPDANNETISASNYNQTCSADSDCVAIAVGDPCRLCCANAAINKADQAKYNADVAEDRAECRPVIPCTIACLMNHAACTNNKCTVVPGR